MRQASNCCPWLLALQYASSIGPHTAQLFERILNEKPHPEMGASFVPRNHPLGTAVLNATRGGRCGTSAARPGVPLARAFWACQRSERSGEA